MNIKNHIFIVSIIMMALCLVIGAVSATDIDDGAGTNIESVNQVDSEILTEDLNDNGENIADPEGSDPVVTYDTVYVVNQTVEVPEGVFVPYTDIAEGINHTNDDGTVVLIEGIYHPESTIVIDKNLTIVGENNNVVIDGTASGRIFEVASGVNVNLVNLTLINGHADKGAAIYNEGNLTVYRCIFENNTVDVDGVGVNIYTTGPLNLSSSILLNSEISKYGVYTYRSAPATANKNWWGTNNPSDVKSCNFNLDNWVVLNVVYGGNPIVRELFSLNIDLNTLNTGGKLSYGEYIPNHPIDISVDNRIISKNASEVSLELMLNPTNASADIIIKLDTEQINIDVLGAPLYVDINASRTFGDYSEDLYATIVMKDQNARGYVTFVINDTFYNETLIGGKASFTVPAGLEEGLYYFNVTYSGDDSYNETFTENGLTLRVRPVQTSLILDAPYSTYESYDVTIGAFVENEKDLPLNGTLYISFFANGELISNETLDIETYASFSFKNLAQGNFTIIATYDAGHNFSIGAAEATITVMETDYNITANSIRVTYNDGKTLAATLFRNGDFYPGQYVTLSIGGKTVKALTDASGVARFSLLYPAKVYDAEITYKTASVHVKVTVIKANTRFTSVTKNVKLNKYFQLKLIDSKSQPVKSVKITIKIGKKSYNVKTNARGIAKLKITKSVAKVGKYTVTYTFAGNSYYNGKTGKRTLTVKK